MKMTVAQLARQIGAELTGDTGGKNRKITAVGPVEKACESEVTFITNDRFLAALRNSQAGAVILQRPVPDLVIPQMVVDDVNAALIKALRLFAPKLKPPVKGINPTAQIGQDVHIAKDVSIGAAVVVEDGAQIGRNSILGSGCRVGQNTQIGQNCRLDSNVVVYHNCKLGDNVIIQANATVGSTGFGYTIVDGAIQLIPHNGGVIIEDFVEIGANCCIDRAKFGNTIIGAGTKIDNLVQIAHNVEIGKCCLIAGLVGIAGSCKVGDGVVLGGQAGLTDNIKIGSGAMVAGGSAVLQDVPAGAKMAGSPAVERMLSLRIAALNRRFPAFAEKLRQLAKRMEELEAAKDNKK